MNYKHIPITNILLYIFILLSGFSYIKLLPNNMDTQPWYIIISIFICLIFILKNKTIYRENLIFIYLLFSYFIVLTIDILTQKDFLLSDLIRNTATYISLFTVSFSFIYCLKKKILTSKLILFFIIIWFIGGTIQFFINSNFFSFILDSRTSPGRGVTGFSPEPTFYAIIITLLYFLFYLTKTTLEENISFSFIFNKVLLLVLLQVFIFSKSSMMMLFWLIVFLFSYIVYTVIAFKEKKITQLIILFIGIFILLILTYSIMLISNTDYINSIKGYRFYKIFQISNNGLSSLVYKDASINDRVAHLVIPWYGLIKNYLFPGGFYSFIHYLDNKNLIFEGIFWYGSLTNKIMSYIGSVIYELGFLSFPYIFYILASLIKFISQSKNKKGDIILSCSFFTLIFLSIPLSNPIVTGFITTIAYINYQNFHMRNN